MKAARGSLYVDPVTETQINHPDFRRAYPIEIGAERLRDNHLSVPRVVDAGETLNYPISPVNRRGGSHRVVAWSLAWRNSWRRRGGAMEPRPRGAGGFRQASVRAWLWDGEAWLVSHRAALAHRIIGSGPTGNA